MKIVRSLLSLAAVLAFAAPASAKIQQEKIEYKQGETVLEGEIFYDDASDAKRPGVLVAHEWLGLDDYAKQRAGLLAGMGYVAFALDMYGKGVHAKDHDEAGKLAGGLKGDRATLRARAAAALEVLKAHKLCDATKIAAIGYCFGGTSMLELARSGADLRAVVSFHGALDTPHPEDAKNIKGKILICQGGDDKFTIAALPAFEDEMRHAKVDWQVNVYGGAVHSFTVPMAGKDPSTGMAYDKNADKRSWKAMQGLFEEVLK